MALISPRNPVPSERPIFSSFQNVNVPATTTAEVTVYSVTIPAGVLGPNGQLDIALEVIWQTASCAGGGSLRAYLGGTLIASSLNNLYGGSPNVNEVRDDYSITITNQNDATKQSVDAISRHDFSSGWFVIGSSFSIDMTKDQVFKVTFQMGAPSSSGQFMALQDIIGTLLQL